MIIWLNGPYGIGKSTLARAIKSRAGCKTIIFDAEKVGDAVRDSYPKEYFNALYEDYPLWNEMVLKLLLDLSRKFNGLILVPMTLIKHNSVETIINALKAYGISVVHILLTADSKSIRKRILMRGENENCWCMSMIDKCLIAQNEFSCDMKVNTANSTEIQTADKIIECIKL